MKNASPRKSIPSVKNWNDVLETYPHPNFPVWNSDGILARLGRQTPGGLNPKPVLRIILR
jgi:hypothetical protein